MGKRFVASRNIEEPWLKQCPQVIRSCAIRDLKAAFDSNFAKRKINPEHTFDIKFKAKKDDVTAVRIERVNGAFKVLDDGKHVSFFPKSLKPMGVDPRALQGIELKHDITLTKDRLGRFTLHVPYRRENQAAQEPDTWCAIDPGVRTFATVFSPADACKIGDGAATRLAKLCAHLDKLTSDMTKASGLQRRQRMKKAQVRVRNRIVHLVDELHWQAASFLCKHYTDILLPVFESQKMACRLSRKIGSKTARSMLTLSHYKFRMRLIDKAREHGCRVHLCTEEYTSKTCTRCGALKHNLGGAKVYRCPVCMLRIDRDIAGGRNIFLKNAVALK
ncbi:putative transposase R104 [Chlorella vulgaris]